MNGVDAHSHPLVWRKSSRSGGGNQCVEVASLTDAVAIRDSKDPNGPAHFIKRGAFHRLITQIKHNDRDL